jgi:peptidoglycan/xylan/chitin deacetylase (PgdA/CDA1 family)
VGEETEGGRLVRVLGGRVRRLLDRVEARVGSSALILLYHRVADEASDPYGLCVSPDEFLDHLRVIGELARPAALGEVVAGLRQGAVPRRAVCVTLDDGYADNLRVAKPLLERCGVPATVFVAAGPGGREREFWWDELEAVLLGRPRVPSRLELRIGGAEREWDLGAGAFDSPQALRDRPGWAFDEGLGPVEPRVRAFREIYDLLQPMATDAQNEVLDQLNHWVGSESALRVTHRSMTPDEVSELERGGLVEVGAHTWSHPRLSVHPEEVQRREIAMGKATLEEWLGHRVDGFAYPFGAYSARSVEIAREVGFDYACSCRWGPVVRRTDPMILPRLELPARGAEALGRQLTHFFGPA